MSLGWVDDGEMKRVRWWQTDLQAVLISNSIDYCTRGFPRFTFT